MAKQLLSFVIPVKDEEQSLPELFAGICQAVDTMKYQFEVIFIDDGSVDSSWEVIRGLSKVQQEVVLGIRLRSNFGKAEALNKGFEAANGEIIFTLDADLQDDPAEIPRFLEKLEEGFDIVTGWKKVRHDPWHKVLPSRVFNKLLSTLVGVSLHDHNCGFKCYRREVAKRLEIYGHRHRMIPSLASIYGYRTAEIVVTHHARRFGESKYGIRRFLHGLMDMMTVCFLKYFRERPLHFMGGLALLLLLVASLSLFLGQLLFPSFATVSSISAGTLISGAIALFAVGLASELTVSRTVELDDNLSIAEQTTFLRSLPSAKNAVVGIHSLQETSIRLESETQPEQQRKTVLIADDDPKIRRLIEYQLPTNQYYVVHAKDGKEAVDKVDNDTAIVFLDLMMPEKNGLECLPDIKRKNSQVSVIMISAHGEIEQAVQAMKRGAEDYISKPFDPQQVLEAVERTSRMQALSAEYRALQA